MWSGEADKTTKSIHILKWHVKGGSHEDIEWTDSLYDEEERSAVVY